jgi:hypothetical protein
MLKSAKFYLNDALSNTKAKADTKLTELVLYCAKSMVHKT